MFIETIESIKRKIRERKASKDESIQEYCVDYLCLGYYDKRIYEENGLSYSYKHSECFLLDSKYVPTQAICLTGSHCDCFKPVRCQAMREPNLELFSYKYCVPVNGVVHDINLKPFNCRLICEETATLEDIVCFVDTKNQIAKENARKTAFEKTELESGFSK